ncbi:MAG: DUF2723 domain-containing protein [Candidatus Levybacteria bacterium]|nr:DUF2723 domain-containing protein [Candidatus Levybacteria bacterium]
MKKTIFLRVLLPLLAFAIPFVVYFYTLFPSVAPGDSTEMLTVATVLGVPHQPGYPFNTLLGNIASKLPIPLNIAQRVHLASAFLQSLTVVMLYFLVLELYSLFFQGKVKNNDPSIKLIAFASSMFLAFSLIFWQYATKFEVFPLNNLFAVTLLLLAVKIHRKFSFSLSLLFIFLSGFAFSHHQTIILIFPCLIFLLWKDLREFIFEKIEKVSIKHNKKYSNKVFSIRLAFKKMIFLFFIFCLGIAPFFWLLIFISSKNPPLNWGEVKTIGEAFSALRRSDFGTVSSFLVGPEGVIKSAPIEHIKFYLNFIKIDFSLIGIIFAALGVYYLWKENKKILAFISIGFLISGFVFLSYANFPLSDSFNQATVRRFHMLPNIFIVLFISFGLLFLSKKISSIDIKTTEQKTGMLLAKIILLLMFIIPLVSNFSKANNKNNNLTFLYTIQAYSKTPDNALILLSGDIPDMTADYFRFTQLKGKDHRIIFTPGQFHLKWFIPSLNRKYPDLVIPSPMPGKRFTTTTQVVDANYGKWPIYVGPDLVIRDPELEKKYTLYPENLLFLVKRKGEDLKLEAYRDENDNLWKEINPELLKKVKKNSPMFEESIVFYYARHFYNFGYVFEQVKLYEDAIREYKRVLEIEPAFKEAYSSLAQIYGYKLDPPEYQQAINYLGNYRSLLAKNDFDLDDAAQGMIYDLYTKEQKAIQEMQKADAISNASASASMPATMSSQLKQAEKNEASASSN